MRLTIIARSDLTGLGNQSRNWVRLLKPNKVVVIDSISFNGNEQHPEWYQHENTMTIDGFIDDSEIDKILEDTDILLTFEIPYNYNLFARAKELGIKTVLQNNWEFTDYLQQTLPRPDLFMSHSYWHLDDQRVLLGRSWYVPTPVFVDDYAEIYADNLLLRRPTPKFLHVAGRQTVRDRNGTLDLIKAVESIPDSVKFQLVIKTQTAEVGETHDPRIVIDRDSPEDEKELYRGFDAMIMPRKFGGACMPMTEALAAGLPVIMTNVEPNDRILPREWLVSTHEEEPLMTRTLISVDRADQRELSDLIVKFAKRGLTERRADSKRAREIAVKEYSPESVLAKWKFIMSKLRKI